MLAASLNTLSQSLKTETEEDIAVLDENAHDHVFRRSMFLQG